MEILKIISSEDMQRCPHTYVDVKNVKQKNIDIWFSDTGTIPKHIYKKLEHLVVMRKKSKVANTTEIEFITNLEDLSDVGRRELESFAFKHGIKAVDYSETMNNSSNLSHHGERVHELIKAAVLTKKHTHNRTRRQNLAIASDIVRFAAIDGAPDDTICAYFDINDEKLPLLDTDLNVLQEKMAAIKQPFIQAGRKLKGGLLSFHKEPFLEARNDVIITKKSNNPELFQHVIQNFDAHLDSPHVQTLHKRATEGITINHDTSDSSISVVDSLEERNSQIMSKLARMCSIGSSKIMNEDEDLTPYSQANIEVDLQALKKHKSMSGKEVLGYAHTMNIVSGDYNTGAMWLTSDDTKKPLNTSPTGEVINPNNLIYSARDNRAAFTWTGTSQLIFRNMPLRHHPSFTHEPMPEGIRQEDWTIEEYVQTLPKEPIVIKPSSKPQDMFTKTLGTLFIKLSPITAL